jgi:hypothetical protein
LLLLATVLLARSAASATEPATPAALAAAVSPSEEAVEDAASPSDEAVEDAVSPNDAALEDALSPHVVAFDDAVLPHEEAPSLAESSRSDVRFLPKKTTAAAVAAMAAKSRTMSFLMGPLPFVLAVLRS